MEVGYKYIDISLVSLLKLVATVGTHFKHLEAFLMSTHDFMEKEIQELCKMYRNHREIAIWEPGLDSNLSKKKKKKKKKKW